MFRATTLPRSASWWAWLAVAALLLKAAVPLLASASARLQDKALVEICTGYGVATVALAEAGADSHAPAQASASHADHCTLSSLLALAAPITRAALPAAAPEHTAATVGAAAPLPCDACARWAAGLRHAPPPLA